jgi:hypothetical protein
LSPADARNRGPLGRRHQTRTLWLIRGGVEAECEGGTEGSARKAGRAVGDAATEQGSADAASRHHGRFAAVRTRVTGPVTAGTGLATAARHDFGLIASRKIAAGPAGRFTATGFAVACQEIGTETVLITGAVARRKGRRFAARRLLIADEGLGTIVIRTTGAAAGRKGQ